jgi:hypothetical protein
MNNEQGSSRFFTQEGVAESLKLAENRPEIEGLSLEKTVFDVLFRQNSVYFSVF